MISKRRDCRGRKCTSVLHGAVCRRTTIQHKSDNKTKRKTKKKTNEYAGERWEGNPRHKEDAKVTEMVTFPRHNELNR